MKVDQFDYYLPEELIAQHPLEKRSSSRLLVLDRKNTSIAHKHFNEIIDYFKEGDVLVLNNTKVIPSRIYGNKVDTGAKIEFLLLKELDKDVWQTLVRPQRRVKKDTVISFKDGLLKARCLEVLEDGITIFSFEYEGVFLEILEAIGSMPLPPYIHEKLKDNSRYQTVYAKDYGSAAAPTAGLHFDQELLEQIRAKGVEILEVTLEVGLGTFRPVACENVEEHVMHSEKYSVSKNVAERLNLAKSEERRIIACGTTCTRTLESVMQNYGKFVECNESTKIFIYPGYKFKAIDGLITNFHLPKSTLIMLVCAFAGYDFTMKAYNEAVELKYRFFSFGDAMLIL